MDGARETTVIPRVDLVDNDLAISEGSTITTHICTGDIIVDHPAGQAPSLVRRADKRVVIRDGARAKDSIGGQA
jgi:hypothetical protein